jgi:hypothetical protein
VYEPLVGVEENVAYVLELNHGAMLSPGGAGDGLAGLLAKVVPPRLQAPLQSLLPSL